MNRPIKFRAKGSGLWRYGQYVHTSKNPQPPYNRDYTDFIVSFDDFGYHHIPITDIDTLGQFTGLLDCNDKEIYEGDILQSDKPNASLCVVFWSTEKTAFIYRFYWKRIDDTQEIGKKSRYTIGDWNMIEKGLAVIGNIHDNPELIEKIE